MVREEEGRLTLDPDDPIPPGPPPRLYDSRLEERFARDFTRVATDWELVREPEPVAADGTLVFPDFALAHRRDPGRRWVLEIVGFWTAGYVEQKLRRLRSASVHRLILCIDESRDCGEEALPDGSCLVRFRKRIDPAEVLKIIDGTR